MMTDDVGEFSVCSKRSVSVDVELNQTRQFRFSLTQLDHRRSVLDVHLDNTGFMSERTA
jgi:hypothetical protein